jgi:hypothetical protein
MAKYKYIELTYEQVEGLAEAEYQDFKLTLSDFGGKLRIPQKREELDVAIAQLLSAVGSGVVAEPVEAVEDPRVAELEAEVRKLKEKLKLEAAKPAPVPVNKRGFPKGEPHGTFDNSETGFREVWKLGTLDVKWPRAIIERHLSGTTSKPWGYYPKFPKV